MSSNPSYQQFGVEAMNSCFISSSMISAEAPFFHPNMPQDGSFGFSDPAAGADIPAHFKANSMMIASPANQLVCAAPLQDSHHGSMSSEEMNDAYVASESCSTVHSMLPTACSVDFQYGPSDVTIAQPSKMAKLTGEPQCSWIYDRPSATSIHEPYYLAGFSGTGFSNPFAAGSAAASELSLRLGAKSSPVSMVNLPDQSSEVSCSGLTHVNSKGFGYQQPLKAQAGTGLFQPPYGDVGAGNEPRQVYPQMYSRPLHFSQVLSRSRYAHIAQEILNGVVGCLLKDVTEITDSVSGVGREASLLLSSSCSTRTPSAVSSSQLMFPSEEHPHDAADSGRWMEAQKLRNDLLKLLQLMDQKCNQCFDDIQNTTSKFSNMVHSGGASSISAPFAHHAVSVMYRRLRKRTMSQIMVVTQRSSRGESSLAEEESSFIQNHRALQQLRRGDQQPWRPQRGLPEMSVAVLKAWMFENFLRPYPKDNEKEMLAARSGLTRSQVSNWFINARVRLWKPMIEEMYEELKKTSGGSEGVAVEHLSSKDVVS